MVSLEIKLLDSAGQASQKLTTTLLVGIKPAAKAAEPVDVAELGELIGSFTMTDEMIDGFMEVTGDENPVHKGKDRIAHGMLTMALAKGLVGGSYETVKSKFKTPVRPGDQIDVYEKTVENGVKERTVVIKGGPVVMTLKLKN